MATIKCPKCKEKLQAGAQVCRYCKHNFDDAEVSTSRAAARSSTYSKMALAIVFLIAVAWCKSQPEATPQEKQDVANLLGLPAAAADPANVKTDEVYFNNSTKQKCKESYPSDFSMRAACARNDQDGLNDFIKIWNDHTTDPEFVDAMSMCFAKYTKDGITDFSMLGACARNQLEGYDAIR